MKRHIVLIALFLGFSLSLLATNNPTDRKVVASNYAEVISTVEYPTVCREQAIEGTVLVTINVNKLGKIKSYAITSSPCSDLTAAVEKVIPSLTFQPAIVEGKEVSSKITIPVKFQLEY
jgi:TonB family protein